MARKPSDRRHGSDELEELNLAPIMAILVILIPVLLYAFSFFEVKVQAVSAPRMGPSNSKPKDDEQKEKPLNLTVLITEQGFTLKQQAELTGEPDKPIYKRAFQRCEGGGYCDESGDCCDAEGKNCRACLPPGAEEYDFPALYNKLVEKKKGYPGEKIINIGAEFDVPWHVVARTIDASRLRLEKDSYTKMESYSEAAAMEKPDKSPVDCNIDGDLEKFCLFPAVVFVVAE